MTTLECTLVCNLADGRQLTGSGYRTAGEAMLAMAERVRSYRHLDALADLAGFLIISSAGHVWRFDPLGNPVDDGPNAGLPADPVTLARQAERQAREAARLARVQALMAEHATELVGIPAKAGTP